MSISFIDVPYLFDYNGIKYTIEQLTDLYDINKEQLQVLKDDYDTKSSVQSEFCDSYEKGSRWVQVGSKAYVGKWVAIDPNLYENDKKCNELTNMSNQANQKYVSKQNVVSELGRLVQQSELERSTAMEERKRQIIEYETISSTFKTIEEKPVESAISIGGGLLPLAILGGLALFSRGKK